MPAASIEPAVNGSVAGRPAGGGAYEHFTTHGTFGRNDHLLVGRHGSHVRVSHSAYLLLQARRAGQPFCTIAAQAKPRPDGSRVSALECEQQYNAILDLLGEVDARGPRRTLPGGFWFRWPLISAERVAGTARYLTWLYSQRVAFGLIALIGASIAIAFTDGLFRPLEQNSLLAGYALFVASLLFHEYGHAAACLRFGVRPSEIGITVYLIYPALYSDVSNVWRLSRSQRVVVDLGGNYFQLLIGVVLLWSFLLTQWEPLRVALVLIVIAAAFSLNPVFKFDGYWVFADACGVSNLSRQPGLVVRHIWRRLRYASGEPLPWSLEVACWMGAYAIASAITWGLFWIHLLPRVLQRLQDYDARSAALASGVATSGPSWPIIAPWLTSTFLLVTTLLMLWRAGLAIVRILRRGIEPLRALHALARASWKAIGITH